MGKATYANTWCTQSLVLSTNLINRKICCFVNSDLKLKTFFLVPKTVTEIKVPKRFQIKKMSFQFNYYTIYCIAELNLEMYVILENNFEDLFQN